MTPENKENLLLRLFSSIEYMEVYSSHFVQFIDTGLLALKTYESLPNKPVSHPDFSLVQNDIRLWHLKVKPNFLGMKENMLEAIEKARSGNFSTMRSAAANVRGLSKDMDGIKESFMDFIDPTIKERYFSEWEIVGTMGDNIYKTLGQRWRPGSILDESITGPIDENSLLKYLRPGEQP